MMQSQQIPMTFQRYETKYMLSPIMARKLRKSLPGHLQMDEYGLDTICSLYYDTPDHQLIRRSLEKPVYKEKLRLRSYGPAKETSPIYVELKKKYEGIATFCKSEKRRKNINQSIERKLREQIQFQICTTCTFWSCDGTRCHLVHRTVLRHEFYAKSNEHRHDPSRFPDGYRIIPGNAIFCFLRLAV